MLQNNFSLHNVSLNISHY